MNYKQVKDLYIKINKLSIFIFRQNEALRGPFTIYVGETVWNDFCLYKKEYLVKPSEHKSSEKNYFKQDKSNEIVYFKEVRLEKSIGPNCIKVKLNDDDDEENVLYEENADDILLLNDKDLEYKAIKIIAERKND